MRLQAMSSSTVHYLLFLLLLLLLSLLPTSFTCTVDSGSSLSSLGQEKWPSPSGEFAFGFRQPQPLQKDNLFLLAIWFEKMPNQTIVWSANGMNPAPAGSTVSLTSNGELILQTPLGDQLWKANANGAQSTCAAMQDDGNFVLLDTNSNATWESFKYPTDTILPGQILSMPSNLTARLSAENYSDGPFQLQLQLDGNLVLYYVSMPTGSQYGSYWASNTVNANSTTQLIYDQAGYIYLKDGTTMILNLTTNIPTSSQDFYHMARIDSDGVFRQYTHPKDGKCNMDWSIVETIPQDICLAITMDIGSGACGYNSYCVNANGRSNCLCPDKYSYVNQDDKRQGCKPDFPLPSCQNDGWEANQNLVKFIEYENIDWPFSDYDLQTGSGIDNQTCMQLCREDCFCAAAIYNGNNCWKKKYPLSNGRKSTSVNRTAFIKVPVQLPQQGYITKKDQSTLVIVGSLLLGGSVFLNILLFSAISVAFYLYRKKVLNAQPTSSVFATNVRSYTYKELEEATRGFKQILGRGAFGTVYKGVLASEPKRFVAIKKLDKLEQEGEKEFKTEVSVIGQTHHKNLVRLLGYCDEGEQRLLVYEYMSNGSLASFLFGISRPDWNQRVQIAFGISRGLMYLHEECSTQTIHCDIKPQNILLDEYFTPRIADFGLAKLLLAEQTKAARTAIRGTVGYFAPEWFRKASITVKVDVYSFGMMLLEIICCKSSVTFAMGNQEEALMDWVYNCYKQRKLDKLVENDEEARNDMKRLERLVMVAIWCIQEDATLRPSMKKATQMLEGVIEVSVPPCPWNYSTS